VADRFTIDSNILIYAADLSDPARQKQAEELVRHAALADCVLTSIALAECFWVSVGKLKIAPADAETNVQNFGLLFPTVEYTFAHITQAVAEHVAGRLSFFDAIVLACAADAGCSVCFSEDMKDGARLGSIVVRNPFGTKALTPTARRVLGIK
jgi:predicted nucleic acid-binding protein